MSEEERTDGRVSKKTSRSAKITIAIQTIIILFLGYWAFEEYQNNIYFQSYVNTTLQVYMLPIAAIVFGVPALTAFGFFFKRSRGKSSEHLLAESGISSPNSFGISNSSSRGKSENVSPIYAELSSRFGQSIASPVSATNQSDQNKQSGLQNTDQSSGSRIKTGPSGLPILERVEPRQQTLEVKEVIPSQRYQAPKQFEDSPQGREAAYRPAPPNFPRQPDNSQVRSPPPSAPMVRPPTVVTGVMGQGPRPYTPAPPPIQPPTRPSPGLSSQPIQDKWQAGARPPAPLVSMPRPPQFNPTNTPAPSSSFGAGVTGQPTSGLSRVGPVKSPGDKTPSAEPVRGLNRIEPIQAVANRLPFPKSQPQTSGDNKEQTFSPNIPASEAQPSSYSSPFTVGKPLQPGKRDDKREVSGENTGS